jgi:hypothetical protein
MVTEHQHEQDERLETLRNDVDVRRQQQKAEGSTMHQFAQEETLPRGRFDAAVPKPHVIGSKAAVASAYPAASAAHQTELPPEPPTGYCIDEI